MMSLALESMTFGSRHADADSTAAGFALSLFGLISIIWVVIEALLFGTPIGWASLMAATLLLSGVQLLILGILGEYIGRPFLTANRIVRFDYYSQADAGTIAPAVSDYPAMCTRSLGATSELRLSTSARHNIA
jgi:hypothetical protein